MVSNNRFRRAVSVAAMSAGMLLGGVGLAWAATVIGTSITLENGSGLRTTVTAGETALLQAYDVDGTAYTTFATLTANNTPTMDLSTSVTIGSDTIVSLTGTQTLTNKTLNLTNNTLSGTTAQFNTALSDGSFATLAGSETLTNKTLTAPIFSSISNTGTLTLPTSTDTLVGRATTDTLTNKTLTSPAIGTTILDTNGNELLNLTATGSAVNELTLANAATSGAPSLAASGGDTNINIALVPKGSGVVSVSGGLALGTDVPFSIDKGTASATGGAATLNKPAGTITTASLTTTSATIYTLTLTNSFVTASSIVLATVSNNTNTQGAPMIGKITPASGSVTIEVANAGWGTTDFNGTLDIDFVVIN